MAISNYRIGSASIPVAVYTAAGEQAITTIILCNTSDVSDAIASIWLVPAGNARSNSNMIINDVSIPAKETFALDTERFIFGDGDSIWVQSSVDNAISCTISAMATH